MDWMYLCMLHVALLTSCCAVHRRAGAEEVTSLQRADGVLLRCTALALPYRIVVPAVLGQQGTTGTARLKRRGDGASREGKWRRGWMGWGSLLRSPRAMLSKKAFAATSTRLQRRAARAVE
jgi:hypothetical protein